MKVRIKELAQEAKFIRLEETKVKARKVFVRGKFGTANPSYSELCSDFWSLNSHRKVDVREAARAAQIAYGFLKGVPYSKIESKRKPEKEYRFTNYILPEVKRLTKKFGKLWNNESYETEINEWLNT